MVLLTFAEFLSNALSTTDPIPDASGYSVRTAALTRAWLENCSQTHVGCGRLHYSCLPARVVHVGNSTNSPFLHCSRGESGAYIALSYCWGVNQNLTTTLSNLTEHTTGLCLDSMPKTFQDAIVVAREFGVQYLWIDALCIVQDSPADWAREAASMAGVYSNALFTIQVKDARGCEEGFLSPKPESAPAMLALDLTLPGLERSRKQASKFRRWIVRSGAEGRRLKERTRKFPGPVLDTRAWTLQEDLLSRRVLEFWRDHLSWRCLVGKASDTFPMRRYDHVKARNWQDVIRVSLANSQRAPDAHPICNADLLDAWLRTVENFCVRKLSHPKDKLFAIEGLQSCLAAFLDDVPAVGCWRHQYFGPSLLWTAKPAATASEGASFTCPSWSWACATSDVKYLAISSLTFQLTALSWNLSSDASKSHIFGTITVQGKLLKELDLLVDLSFLAEYDKMWHRQFKREQNKRMVQMYRSLSMVPHKSYETGDGDESDEPTKFDFSTVTQDMHHKYQTWTQKAHREGGRTSMIIERYNDPHFAAAKGEIWYLLLADKPYSPPPKYGYPAWPHGRPASSYFMCLERTSGTKMKFRRIGLIEAWDHPEWRERCRNDDIELI